MKSYQLVGEVWGKPVASGQLGNQAIILQLFLAEMQANKKRQGNSLHQYMQQFEILSEYQKLSKLCSEAGLRQD